MVFSNISHLLSVCFFIQGESVEENANVVVKLLIRRPECFGPALRGEGGQGLLVAMKEAIKISEDPTLDLPKIRDGVSAGYESPTRFHSIVLLVFNIQHLSILIPMRLLLSCLMFVSDKNSLWYKI